MSLEFQRQGGLSINLGFISASHKLVEITENGLEREGVQSPNHSSSQTEDLENEENTMSVGFSVTITKYLR
jgi:hypothetical protein